MRAFSILAALLLAASAAAAQEPAAGPKRIFRDALIDNLVGEWRLMRQICGRDVENTVSADWVLKHQCLRIRMKDVAEPPAYQGLVYIGYKHADQRYAVHWLDVYGDGPYYNTFKWDARTETWTFTMEATGKDGKRELFAVDTLRRN